MYFDPMMNPSRALSIRFSKWHQQWLARHIPALTEVSLHRRNIFILPTSLGLLYIASTCLIFIIAINYVLSLAFGLAFLMLSVFLLGILHTFRNLQHLNAKALPSEAVFCGEDAIFNVQLSRPTTREYEIIELNFPQGLKSQLNLIEATAVRQSVLLKTSRRGLIKAPRLRIGTRFPLGLWNAWSNIDLDMSCLVYPQPIAGDLPARIGASDTGSEQTSGPGTEDYFGLRSYQPGDSLRQVAWKVLARGQGMQMKQFVDYVDDRCMLDWDCFTGASVEQRLSRLCYWVLTLSRSGTPFGLRLPGLELAMDSGDSHRRKALEALALWQPVGMAS
jgi:uncharacterized protein (DUF58 family)